MNLMEDELEMEDGQKLTYYCKRFKSNKKPPRNNNPKTKGVEYHVLVDMPKEPHTVHYFKTRRKCVSGLLYFAMVSYVAVAVALTMNVAGRGDLESFDEDAPWYADYLPPSLVIVFPVLVGKGMQALLSKVKKHYDAKITEAYRNVDWPYTSNAGVQLSRLATRTRSVNVFSRSGSTMKARFEYAFTLLPVATNTFDAVTACVRGLEEENTRLKEDIAAMKDELMGLKQENEQRDAFITAEASGEVDPGAAMKWNDCGDYKTRDFQFQDGGHTVELVRGGCYVIGLVIAPNGRLISNYVVKYEVRVNGKEEQTLCNIPGDLTFSFVVHVPAKALLRVVNVSAHQGKTNACLTIAAI